MATEIENKTLYSVSDAAEFLGVTVGRVRQILGKHNEKQALGTKVGRDWTMTSSQLNRLRKTQRELFRKKFGKYPDED